MAIPTAPYDQCTFFMIEAPLITFIIKRQKCGSIGVSQSINQPLPKLLDTLFRHGSLAQADYPHGKTPSDQ